jgi:hypothetical protein
VATKKKLSEAAQKVHDELAGREVTWGNVKEILGPDRVLIARAWNELVAAGLAAGALSKGEVCEVFKS